MTLGVVGRLCNYSLVLYRIVNSRFTQNNINDLDSPPHPSFDGDIERWLNHRVTITLELNHDQDKYVPINHRRSTSSSSNVQ